MAGHSRGGKIAALHFGSGGRLRAPWPSCSFCLPLQSLPTEVIARRRAQQALPDLPCRQVPRHIRGLPSGPCGLPLLCALHIQLLPVSAGGHCRSWTPCWRVWSRGRCRLGWTATCTCSPTRHGLSSACMGSSCGVAPASKSQPCLCRSRAAAIRERQTRAATPARQPATEPLGTPLAPATTTRQVSSSVQSAASSPVPPHKHPPVQSEHSARAWPPHMALASESAYTGKCATIYAIGEAPSLTRV